MPLNERTLLVDDLVDTVVGRVLELFIRVRNDRAVCDMSFEYETSLKLSLLTSSSATIVSEHRPLVNMQMEKSLVTHPLVGEKAMASWKVNCTAH